MLTQLLVDVVAFGQGAPQTPAVAEVTASAPLADEGGWSAVDERDAKLERLLRVARSIDPEVLGRALDAHACATSKGDVGRAGNADRLTVIDYSRPSSERRMWVFDLQDEELLFNELVAHGKASGEKVARSFSNAHGSKKTSLGVFVTGETYHGRFGRSLRIDGLEEGVNDNARDRAVVIHGSNFVSDAQVRKLGRISMSEGCPAMDHKVVQPVIDAIQGGSLVFSYYPEDNWLKASDYLTCGA